MMRYRQDSLAMVNYASRQIVDLNHVAADMDVIMGIGRSMGWNIQDDGEEIEVTTMAQLRDQDAFKPDSGFRVYESDGLGGAAWKGGADDDKALDSQDEYGNTEDETEDETEVEDEDEEDDITEDEDTEDASDVSEAAVNADGTEGRAQEGGNDDEMDLISAS